MKTKLFNPSEEFAKKFDITQVSYIYDIGYNIVANFGNIFKMRMMPNVHYVLISIGSAIDKEKMFICSNKRDYNKHPNLKSNFLSCNSFGEMCYNKYYGGFPTNINGKECILLFPFDEKLPFVLDIEHEELLPILNVKYKDCPECKEYFDKMEEFYGDCSSLFPELPEPEIKPLSVSPCGEYACLNDVEYVVAYGWQIANNLSERIAMTNINFKVKYLVILMNRGGKTRLFVYSNKWTYENHDKIEEWMKEDGASKKMLCDESYSGLPCMMNGHKTIICYPFLLYNPVIWDVETDEVFVVPSKEYPEDDYYKMLVERFGDISRCPKGEA